MPGTEGPIKLASTFLGGQDIDNAFIKSAQDLALDYVTVPWRQGAGNDETVWEAPGYEVPFVEVSRCRELLAPYPEYHTSLDTAELMEPDLLADFYRLFTGAIDILENNAVVFRRFQGLYCLSHPDVDLYQERPDPAVEKGLPPDSEKWGYLLDCLLRYFDGNTTVLQMAQRHGLRFSDVRAYLEKFEQKGLVRLELAPMARPPISNADPAWNPGESL
jgi:aminopeptidase-like protein